MSESAEPQQTKMIDVGDKEVTRREGLASCFLTMGPETMARVLDGTLDKGNALEVARIAGIMAAKKTAEVIPLCHPLPLDTVEIAFEPKDGGIEIRALVATSARTGVEMEAMTAASIAALTIYDMIKSIERGATVTSIRLLRKSGGRSGTWTPES